MGRPRKNPLTVINTCEHCNKEYEIKYSKRNQRFCNKKCSNASPKTKQKIKEGQQKVFDEKYGGKHPMQTEATKENFKTAMKEKYGVEHALQNKDLLEKSNNTKIELYGDKNFNNRDKAKETCIEKWGVDNVRKTEEYNVKYKKTCLEKYGTDHASASKQYKLAHKMSMFEKFLTNDRFENFTHQFSVAEYKGVTPTFNQKYPFKCNRCDTDELHDISDGKYPRCSKCDKKFSIFQTEIQDYISTLIEASPMISNDRTILHPFELDIYIPDYKIAIECNSLCFHSEVFGNKNKAYHLNKTKNCSAREIKLIHVLDSEWKLKKDIVKSIFNSIFGKSTKIHGRKCIVKSIPPKVSNKFLNENHIQGADRSSVKLGLFNDDELVSVMTFCKPRFNKHCEWELSRFCNKLNTSVHGGASKLFKFFTKHNNPKNIISYSDRRFFSGEVYLALGFDFIDNTPPGYHYIINGYTDIQNRMSWQKHKLKDRLADFDPSLTEWENMRNHGFDRIWDCGNSKWVWESK